MLASGILGTCVVAAMVASPGITTKQEADHKPQVRATTHTSRTATTNIQRVVNIPSYISCPTTPQACIDRPALTLYHGNILAGHNWAGYGWMAQLKVGTRVKVNAGPVAGTYTVFKHMSVNRRSGPIPYFYGADLVLQSCQTEGTAFSLLKRS